MEVRHVGTLGERNRFPCEPLALLELTATRKHLAVQMRPLNLRCRLLARCPLSAASEPLLGFAVATELEQRLGDVAAVRHVVAEVLEPLGRLARLPRGGLCDRHVALEHGDTESAVSDTHLHPVGAELFLSLLRLCEQRASLVEPAQHREIHLPLGRGAASLDVRMVVQPTKSDLHGGLAEVVRHHELLLGPGLVEARVRTARVLEKELRPRSELRPGAPFELARDDERSPRNGEAPLVSSPLEDSERLLRLEAKPLSASFDRRIENGVIRRLLDLQRERPQVITCRRGAIRGQGQPSHRFVSVACMKVRPREVELEPYIRSVAGQEVRRTLEQLERRAEVVACDRPAARFGESLPCACREGIVVLPEVEPVAVRLLEVVAGELVELDELGAVLLEPAGELLM